MSEEMIKRIKRSETQTGAKLIIESSVGKGTTMGIRMPG